MNLPNINLLALRLHAENVGNIAYNGLIFKTLYNAHTYTIIYTWAYGHNYVTRIIVVASP